VIEFFGPGAKHTWRRRRALRRESGARMNRHIALGHYLRGDEQRASYGHSHDNTCQHADTDGGGS